VSSSSHFFSITAGFGSLCLYVKIELIFLFLKKISVGENLPNFLYLKIYIIIQFSRYSVVTHLITANFQNQFSLIQFKFFLNHKK
jgi:hypothetical protein